MSEQLTLSVNEVRVDTPDRGGKTGRLVGWEIVINGKEYLMFRDESVTPGLRIGSNGFTPGLVETFSKRCVVRWSSDGEVVEPK